jgi:hypothetical protein
MSTCPAERAGEVTDNLFVPLLYETLVPAVVPNKTVDDAERLVPDISTTVPPVVGPNVFDIAVIATAVV